MPYNNSDQNNLFFAQWDLKFEFILLGVNSVLVSDIIEKYMS